MYTALETIPLTTKAHTTVGVTVWIERDQIGWHAYLTTPTLEAQYISSRFFIGNLEALKTMAIECADEATAELTPKTPTKLKTKKTRKTAKRVPFCNCPDCAKQDATAINGVFYCLKGKEYGVFTDNQFLGYRTTQGDAETLFRNHRYTQLTKHAA